MRLLFGFCLFFFALVGQPGADTQVPVGKNPLSSPVVSKPAAIQNELEVLSGTAEDIYDLAKLNKWNKIRKKQDELKKTEGAIKLLRGEENDFFARRLREKIEELEQVIAAKSKNGTMRAANNITLLEVAMIGDLKPRVPANVMLLDYCGRQLEIESEEKDIERLSSIVVRMHLIWQNLIPQLIDKGGTKEIKNFAVVMKRLERAKTPEEFNQSARQVLDEVDNLQRLFKNNPK